MLTRLTKPNTCSFHVRASCGSAPASSLGSLLIVSSARDDRSFPRPHIRDASKADLAHTAKVRPAFNVPHGSKADITVEARQSIKKTPLSVWLGEHAGYFQLRHCRYRHLAGLAQARHDALHLCGDASEGGFAGRRSNLDFAVSRPLATSEAGDDAHEVLRMLDAGN